jgi:glutamine synthetase
MEVPDNNGILRGKIVPLAKALSPRGTAIGAPALAFKGGGHICFVAPWINMTRGLWKCVAVPDLSTAVALPWKGNVAGVLCDYYLNDGTPCAMDPRHILTCAESALTRMNYRAQLAFEYEVFIFEQDEQLMREERFSELYPFGRDRDWASISRSPSFEDLAKEFITRCEAVGIQVEAFHTEYGRAIFEYSLEPQSAVKAADDAVRAKLYLKQLCAERGLIPSYMVARYIGTGDAYCGCHHNFSLAQGSENAFWDPSSGGLSQVARHAATGLLETMPAFTIIHHPWVNSFRRMDRMLGNPEDASWGDDNLFVGIRVVHGAVPEEMTRFEYRAPGADVNPYLTGAAILLGCLRGLREQREPPPYANGDPTLEKRWERLPRTMPEAIEVFRKSPLVAEAFEPAFVEHLASVKEDEWRDFAAAVASPEQALAKGPVTDWEISRYFKYA